MLASSADQTLLASEDGRRDPILPATPPRTCWLPALVVPFANLNYAVFTHLARLQSPFLAANRIVAALGFEVSHPEYGNLLNPAKCLWKWMFVGHSYFRLKVALWMLCNLETSQLHRF